MKTAILSIGASLAAMTMASAANAATYIYTYEGVVETGIDGVGYFGSAGADLSGMGYTASYIVEYPVFGAYENITDVRTDYGGGTYYNAPAVLTGTFTINGFSKIADGTYQSRIFKRDEDSNLDQVYAYANGRYTEGNLIHISEVQSNLYSYLNNITNSTSVDELLSYTYHSGSDYHYGRFFFGIFDGRSGKYLEQSSGNLRLDTLTISQAGAVPEPATWAFMIFGFGAIGGAMRSSRRRETKVAVTYA